jgi:hypothetical protein
MQSRLRKTSVGQWAGRSFGLDHDLDWLRSMLKDEVNPRVSTLNPYRELGHKGKPVAGAKSCQLFGGLSNCVLKGKSVTV